MGINLIGQHIGVGGILEVTAHRGIGDRHEAMIDKVSDDIRGAKDLKRWFDLDQLYRELDMLIFCLPILSVNLYKNITTTVGRTAIAKVLAQEENTCKITYGAVGDDNTAAVVGDTVLANEVARKLVTSISYSGAVVAARLFLNTSEGNPSGGTLKEFGWFGEGASATVDTGTLFTRLVVTETKNSTISLTFNHTININDA